MKSFIKGRVVKSCNVKISAPWIAENNEEFQDLGTYLAIFNDQAASETAISPERLGWADTTVRIEAKGSDRRGWSQGNCKGTVFQTEAKENAAMILAEAKENAAIILAEAKENAAIILAEAENSAQEMRAQAQAESDRLCKEVAEATQAEVYPKAKAEGYEAGRQAGETEGKRAFQNAQQLFRLAQRAIQEEYAKVDNDLLHLAIKIAERIVRASLDIKPEYLAAIMQAISLLPQERHGWKLHVAPEDALWLDKNQPACPCPWVSDESLSAGDCFLECPEGVFDARLEAQLDKLEHILREELQHGELEPIGTDG